MIKLFAYINRFVIRHAGKLLLSGLAAVAWHNWRLWHQDKVLLAANRKPEPLPPLKAWPTLPRVSVLVAAWNEAEHIERHIQSFLDLRYPHKELILSAGGDDGTYELAEKFHNATVIVLRQQPGEGKQRALQRALGHARGEVVYLTDADCQLDDDSFERTLYPIGSGVEEVCTGGARPIDDQFSSSFVRCQWSLQNYRQLQSNNYSKGLLGRNCAATRSVIELAWKAGDRVPTGTDYYLALRVRQAGHKIRFVRDSLIQTEFPTNPSIYIRQQTRWLRNLLLLGHRFNDSFHFRHALQTAMLGCLFLALPVLLFLGPLGAVLWLLAWGSVLIRRIRYAALTIKCEKAFDVTEIATLPDLILLMICDFVAWSKILIDVWHPRKREQW